MGRAKRGKKPVVAPTLARLGAGTASSIALASVRLGAGRRLKPRHRRGWAQAVGCEVDKSRRGRGWALAAGRSPSAATGPQITCGRSLGAWCLGLRVVPVDKGVDQFTLYPLLSFLHVSLSQADMCYCSCSKRGISSSFFNYYSDLSKLVCRPVNKYLIFIAGVVAGDKRVAPPLLLRPQ